MRIRTMVDGQLVGTRKSLGVIGKVKTGQKNDRGLPTSLDYFRFTSDHASRIEKARELYGGKPSLLPLTFHSDDVNEVCSQRFEIRNNSGRLAAYGDGVDFYLSTERGWQPQTDKDLEGIIEHLSGGKYKAEWKQVLTLRFLLLEYPARGLWEFRTGAKATSIPQIIGTFDSVIASSGTCIGVPFVLSVKKHKSNRLNANRQYPIVNLTCDYSPESLDLLLKYGSEIKGLKTPEKLHKLLSE